MIEEQFKVGQEEEMIQTLDAYDFAKPHGKDKKEFRFGVHPEITSEALKRFTKQIDVGKIVLQDIKIESHATIDDFTMTTMTIIFVERQ